MANLAIKGHPTRGKEVIEILEMLGGANLYSKSCSDSNLFCYLSNEKRICELPISESYREITLFTLEEFLEKFPYKVGDRVKTIYGKIGIVSKPIWSNRDNCIRYELEADTDSFYFINELQPYKEETMDRKYNVETYLKVWDETEKGLEVLVNDRFELKEDNGKFYIVKKQPKYPKTYVECAKLLDCFGAAHIDGYKGELLDKFQELLICRDAYWKIAGEQMGLGKPWEPDWLNTEQDKFVLYTHDNVICLNRFVLGHNVLAFPTAEMRDAFLENFKDLIELCKELL